MSNMLFPVAVEKVDNRNLNHCITTRTLAHGSTRTTNKHLGCERRIIYSHVELEKLVLCDTRYALACKVHTMTHVKQIIHTWNLFHMSLIIDKIRVGLYCC